jgi:hypothetical protein
VLRGRLYFDIGDAGQARVLLGEGLAVARDVRAALTVEERALYDTRPEIRLLGALWRLIPR